MQTARSVGPIPQDDYTIGAPRHSNHVSAAIDREGASAFFRSPDDQATEKLFDNIGSGREGWVAPAPNWLKEQMAQTGGLGIALAYALLCNAAAVLKVVDPLEGDSHILAVSSVCGIAFIENAPKDYNAKAMCAVSTVSTGN